MAEYGFEAVLEAADDLATKEEAGEVPLWRQLIAGGGSSQLKPRPPVVTILGHVDHGKTSLLDAIRSTEVAAAKQAALPSTSARIKWRRRRLITFLDTPVTPLLRNPLTINW